MIELDKVSVRAGAFSLSGVSMLVPEGTYAVLMGRTGSGKTTILETICGLKPASGGRVMISGRDVTRTKPALRAIGYVPQDGALFSSMTVRQNLGFALSIRRWSPAEIGERVDELAGLLGLSALLERFPFGLSGGEKQRVALGRALAARPPVLLLDEPLSALDEGTRGEMYSLLKSVRAKTGVTVLHVTHSSTDAAELADLKLVIQDGTIQAAAGKDVRNS
ncbi:MAG: ABC transporter ATP-binding protein [Verrucomicrobia bacterium]|nr:ABC transporter ATP-binding protein [Verrucomicrobiota bacterium]